MQLIKETSFRLACSRFLSAFQLVEDMDPARCSDLYQMLMLLQLLLWQEEGVPEWHAVLGILVAAFAPQSSSSAS